MASEVFTVRMGIFDTRSWSAQDVVNLYKSELKSAGFSSSQMPSMSYPPASVRVTKDDPFPGAKSIVIGVAPFSELSQTRDTRVPYSQDPAKLADAGRAFASVFAWNLCFPVIPQISPSSPAPGAVADPAGTLRDIFRRVKETGTLKLSPKVATWAAAPEVLDGYPPKPPRPECGPVPAPAGAGNGKGMPAWQKALLFVGSLWVAKKTHFF